MRDSNTPTPQTPLTLPQRTLLIGETVARYLAVRRLARTKPLPAVLADVRAARTAPRRAPAVTDNPYRLSVIVQRVLRLLPSDTRCLMQTLTLLSMLTSRGQDGTVVISTKSDGTFAAHAWLELEGRPLLPPEAHEHRLTEL